MSKVEDNYNDYDMMCIFYLGIEIRKMLLLEDCHLYIDAYYNVVKFIYEQYKEHDDKNVSLLDSIHNFINVFESSILFEIKESGCIEL